MVKAKVCIQCSRLLSLNKVECICGGQEFIEIRLNYVEKKQDTPAGVVDCIEGG